MFSSSTSFIAQSSGGMSAPILNSTQAFKTTHTLNWAHGHGLEQDSEQEERVKAKPDRIASVHGHNGITVGANFASRHELWKAGVHGMSQAGIHGRDGIPAYSIVMSGRYADDLDDGETFVYSGEGGTSKIGPTGKPTFNGKQCANQEGSRGNRSLQLSAVKGKRAPVRVVRGHTLASRYAPEAGYRYDGLYEVTEVIYETGKSDFKTYQFKFKRLPGQPPLPNEVLRPKPRFKKMATKTISPSPSSSQRLPDQPLLPNEALQPEPRSKKNLAPKLISPSPSSSRLPSPPPLLEPRSKKTMAAPESIASPSSLSAPGQSFSEWRVATVASLSNWTVTTTAPPARGPPLSVGWLSSRPLTGLLPQSTAFANASQPKSTTMLPPTRDSTLNSRPVARFPSERRYSSTSHRRMAPPTRNPPLQSRPVTSFSSTPASSWSSSSSPAVTGPPQFRFAPTVIPPSTREPPPRRPAAGWSRYSSPGLAHSSQRTFTSMPPPTRDPPFPPRSVASLPPSRSSFSSTPQWRTAPPTRDLPLSSGPVASSSHDGQGSLFQMGPTPSFGLAGAARPPLSPRKRKLFSSIQLEIDQGNYKRRRDQ